MEIEFNVATISGAAGRGDLTIETNNVDGVLDGALEPFVKAYLIAHPSDDA